jgi:hypothetical protein
LVEIDGLFKIAAGAKLDAMLPKLASQSGGHPEDGNIGGAAERMDGLAELKTGKLRQHQVEEDDAGFALKRRA